MVLSLAMYTKSSTKNLTPITKGRFRYYLINCAMIRTERLTNEAIVASHFEPRFLRLDEIGQVHRPARVEVPSRIKWGLLYKLCPVASVARINLLSLFRDIMKSLIKWRQESGHFEWTMGTILVIGRATSPSQLRHHDRNNSITVR